MTERALRGRNVRTPCFCPLRGEAGVVIPAAVSGSHYRVPHAELHSVPAASPVASVTSQHRGGIQAQAGELTAGNPAASREQSFPKRSK